MPVLDATPAGAAVYRRIGFVSGFEIDRWERPARRRSAPTRARPGDAPVPMPLDRLDDLCDLDRAATGLERRFLLADFLSRPATRAWQSDDGRGFVIARAGRRATQIGPLVGARRRPGRRPARHRHRRRGGDAGRPIFLDLPRAHRPLADRLERQGFARQRPFVRMSLGATRRRASAPGCSFSPVRSSADVPVAHPPPAPPRTSPPGATSTRLRGRLREGLAIPAHPLALDADRAFDARRQRALTRYYLDAGAGGLAVGVHTTQFAIREAGLYETVLRGAIETARDWPRDAPRAGDGGRRLRRHRPRPWPRRGSRAASAITRCCSAWPRSRARATTP